MPAQKRKHPSLATSDNEQLRASRALNTPSSTESPLSLDPATDIPYVVVLLPDINARSKPSKRGKKEDVTAVKVEPAIDNAGDPIAYTITPGSNWEKMKRYKHFVGRYHHRFYTLKG